VLLVVQARILFNIMSEYFVDLKFGGEGHDDVMWWRWYGWMDGSATMIWYCNNDMNSNDEWKLRRWYENDNIWKFNTNVILLLCDLPLWKQIVFQFKKIQNLIFISFLEIKKIFGDRQNFWR
jgi:hypothetical protein